MSVTWQFRLVKEDGTSGFVTRAGNNPPFEGTPEEALGFADQVRNFYEQRTSVRRIEAWSVESIPRVSSDYELFTIARHENGRDWRLCPGRLTHPGWFTSLMDAVDYAAFRGRGHISQIRVTGSTGDNKLILCPQLGMDPFANVGPRAGILA